MSTIDAARRHDLTDPQWNLLCSVLPVPTGRGRPRRWPLRGLINGARYRTRIGCPWRDVPACYGPWWRVYALFALWQVLGVWEQIEAALRAAAQTLGKVKWQVSVDSTTSRGHVHAAGARRDSFGRVTGFVIALVLSKLVLVVIFLVAITQVAAPIDLDLASVSDPLSGIVLMALAGFAPYMTYRFLAFVGTDYYGQAGAEDDAKRALNRPILIPAKPSGEGPKKVLDGQASNSGSGAGRGGAGNRTAASKPPAPTSGMGSASAGGGGASTAGASSAGASAGAGAGAGAAAAGPAAAVVVGAQVTKAAATAGPKAGTALAGQAETAAAGAGQTSAPPPPSTPAPPSASSVPVPRSTPEPTVAPSSRPAPPSPPVPKPTKE